MHVRPPHVEPRGEARLNAHGRAHRFFEEVARAKAQGRAATMGVCNTTPDSFSDGGESFVPADAIARVDRLIAEGAEIVDVGGESTRPGAPRVPAEEQIARVAEVVRYAASRVVVSIDTTSAKVAQRALELGAHAVNDVSLLSEPELAEVVARFDAALVLSHARGFQADMRGFGAWPEHAYGDVVTDVLADFARARERATALGVSASSVVMDPGLGFSKSSAHSLELLRRTAELVARADAAVLIGASRKSFLKAVTGEVEPRERLGASIHAAVHAQRCGAAIVRVHDVRATRQALMLDATLRAADAASHEDLGPELAREPVRDEVRRC